MNLLEYFELVVMRAGTHVLSWGAQPKHLALPCTDGRGS